MRLLASQLLLVLSVVAPRISASPVDNPAQPANLENDVLGAGPNGAIQQPAPLAEPAPEEVAQVKAKEELPAAGSEEEQPTTFNGITVPPMKDIKGEDWDKTVGEGYWFVKHFSPYCHHCHAAAPIWQTLYEFYYTSKPVTASEKSVDPDTSLNSFHGFYNFHFAALNCITSGDQCKNNGVDAWPTFILYKDGKEIQKFKGKKDLESLSHFVEENLETIKPGSRPANGVKLPDVGADSVKTDAEPETPKAKDKDAAAGAAAGEKHNEIASKVAGGKDAADAEAEHKDTDKEAETTKSVTPVDPSSQTALEEATPTKARQPKKPTVTPNIAGESIPLTQESFLKLVTSTKEPWFIKFYAPWCGHCQALAPNWHQMARELQGKLNVGEVNCDVEKRLCKDVGVKGYPTIHYFRGGERVEYAGLRGLGDLVSYAKKAIDVGQGVQYVDATTFKEMEETEEVIFIYFYDHATTEEDFQALERMTLSLVGHAKLVKTDSRVLSDRFKIHTWPRLVVSRDGRPSYYNALAPKDMRDFRQVLNWMQSVWLPIVPELTASNSHEVMNGRYVVLGVLNRDRSDEFVLDKRELKNAALEWMDREVQAFQLERQELRDSKQLRIEEAEDRKDEGALRDAKHMQIHITEADRKQVGFAWVDGVFWERWIRTTYGVDIKDGERVIINDEDNKRYWDTTVTGAPIIPSRSYILETLQKITADPPKIPPKYTTGAIQKAFYQAKGASSSHPVLASVAFLFAVVVVITLSRSKKTTRGRRGTGGFFQLDGKEGLLGGGPNGKSD